MAEFSQMSIRSDNSQLVTKREGPVLNDHISNSAECVHITHNKYMSTEIFGRSIDSIKLSKRCNNGQRRITSNVVRSVTVLNRTISGGVAKSPQFTSSRSYRVPGNRAICQTTSTKVKYIVIYIQDKHFQLTDHVGSST